MFYLLELSNVKQMQKFFVDTYNARYNDTQLSVLYIYIHMTAQATLEN